MKFIQPELGLSAIFNGSAIDEIRIAAAAHYPKEFGGFLIGSYTADGNGAIIDRILLPHRFRSTSVTFERESSGLEAELQRLYELPKPLFYIGEWHSHPDGPTSPSSTDRSAMRDIAAHPSVKIKSPLLLIAGVTRQTVEADLYIYFKNQLYHYEKI